MITDYIILSGVDARDLQRSVGAYLASGWQPLGGPLTHKTINGDVYEQAMVKTA